jgi:hypothetical protein
MRRPVPTADRWYGRLDWVLVGYVLFIVGSLLYFVAALAPYQPALYTNQADGWAGLAAATIFVIESVLYHGAGGRLMLQTASALVA